MKMMEALKVEEELKVKRSGNIIIICQVSMTMRKKRMKMKGPLKIRMISMMNNWELMRTPQL
jgi:hypothetical protein